MAKFGYWVDLQKVTLDEIEDHATWIQAMPLGTYRHPLYGNISFTPEKVQAYADSVNSKVREIDPDVDYDHKVHTGKAAGWIKAAEARADGLWVKVQWTEDAWQSLKKGEYRYFSPEFVDKWDHPKNGKTFKDVLFGGALTNRPHLKDILPINMSEMTEGAPVEEFLKKLREQLKLSEDATEEQILEAAAKAGLPTGPPDPTPDPPAPTIDPTPDQVELARLVEASPAVRSLVEQNKTLEQRLLAQEATTRLAEVNVCLSEWTAPKDSKFKYGIPVALHEALRPILMSGNEGTYKALAKAVEHLMEHGLVELGERVDPRDPSINGMSATERIMHLAEQKVNDSEGKMDFGDALNMVFSEQPVLYEQYRSENMTARG